MKWLYFIKDRLSNSSYFGPAFFLACITILFWGRFLFYWPTPLIFPNSDLGTDLPRELWPTLRFIIDTLKATHILPLWRPYLLSGTPLVGHPVFPVFYPPFWIAYFIPIIFALNLIIAIHFWWCGFGTYLYLFHHACLRKDASLLGALIFAFSPRWMAYVGGGHWGMITAISWWPWAWLAINRFFKTKDYKWAGLLGLSLASQALTDGRILMMCMIWLGLFSLTRVKFIDFSWVKNLSTLWFIAILLIISLTAVQLFPFFELFNYSNRTALNPTDSNFGSLPPYLLLGVMFPIDIKFPEWFIYPGVLTLFLLLIGVMRGWSQDEKYLGGGVIIGCVLCVGFYLPLNIFLFKLIPGSNLVRVPARWWFFVLFSMALLAAHGYQKIIENPKVQNKMQLIPVIILAVFNSFGLIINILAPKFLPFNTLLPFVILSAGFLLFSNIPSLYKKIGVFILFLVELWVVGNGLIKPQAEKDLLVQNLDIAWLKTAVHKDERIFSPYVDVSPVQLVDNSLNAADGYDSFQIEAYSALIRTILYCPFEGYSVSVPPMSASPQASNECKDFKPNLNLLKLLGVRFLHLPFYISQPGTKLVFENGESRIYDIGVSFGRGFGVKNTRVVTAQNCLEELTKIQPDIEALTEKKLPNYSNAEGVKVLDRFTKVNGEEFRVRSEGASLFVRSEVWAPGWDVFVDGNQSELLRIDCALQGVWLQSGEHRVEFVYLPRGYIIGKWVSIISALSLICIILFSLLAHKNRKNPSTFEPLRESR